MEGKLEVRAELGKAGDAGRGECEWKASDAIEGPGARRDSEAKAVGSVSKSSESTLMVGISLYPLVLARRRGPRGRMMKKDRSMKHGRKADASTEVLTDRPIVLVKST